MRHEVVLAAILVAIPLAVRSAPPTVEVIRPSPDQFANVAAWSCRIVNPDSLYHKVWLHAESRQDSLAPCGRGSG